MDQDRLILLFQAALADLARWNALTAQIDKPYLLGDHRALKLVYNTVCKEVKRLNEMPSTQGLMAMLSEEYNASVRRGRPILDKQDWNIVCYLVNNSPAAELSVSEVAKWAGEYITEQLLDDFAEEAPNLDIEDAQERIQEYIAKLDKAQAATQFTSDDFDPEVIAEAAQKNTAASFTPTGIPFIDRYIGGFSSREVYSCLGGTGSAKTTVAVQVAVEYAKLQSNRQHATFGRAPRGLIFYVTTEDGGVKIRNRMVSCAGKIALAKVSGKDKSPKTMAGAPSERDLQICNEYFGGTVFGEIEREELAIGRNRRFIRMIDFTDPEFRGVADDPIDAVKMHIDRCLDDNKMRGERTYCALIIIDHCADLIFNRLNATDKRKDNLFMVTQTLPYRIRDNLAWHYECPVWVVHQASGNANKKKAKQALDHTEALGSASWGMHFNACFNLSQLEAETMLTTWSCTKSRENKKQKDVALRLEGDIGTLVMLGEVEEAAELVKPKKNTADKGWGGKVIKLPRKSS